MIERPYQLAKYPVTNLQYRWFVTAGGYEKREYWSDDGWWWRIGAFNIHTTDIKKRHEPFYWHDLKWNNPITPVVGVSWFEAEAYCNWISKELGKPIRLPTVEEWDFAAWHIDEREYPWGKEFDRNCLNSAEFWGGKNDLDWNQWTDSKDYEVASTTVVGQFDGGISAAGISDMSGNVWEWTNSRYYGYDGKSDSRGVRGGSWRSDRVGTRCTVHMSLSPSDFSDNCGFRVFSPGS